MEVLNMFTYAYVCLLKSCRFILPFPVLEFLKIASLSTPFPHCSSGERGEARGLFARRKARDSPSPEDREICPCGRMSRTKYAGRVPGLKESWREDVPWLGHAFARVPSRGSWGLGFAVPLYGRAEGACLLASEF